MPTNSDRPAESGTDAAIHQRSLPDDLAEHVATVFGFETPPETLAEWTAAVQAALPDAAPSVGPADLCLTDDSRHAVEVAGETQHYACVLDTFILPFLLDDEPELAVRSRCPTTDEVITIDVGPDGIDARPEGAVISFGVTRDPALAVDGRIDHERAYAQLCPYINAFASEAAYEDWAERTPEAVTMSLSPAAGLEIARGLADPGTEV